MQDRLNSEDIYVDIGDKTLPTATSLLRFSGCNECEVAVIRSLIENGYYLVTHALALFDLLHTQQPLH
jgi:hypothetical protein